MTRSFPFLPCPLPVASVSFHARALLILHSTTCNVSHPPHPSHGPREGVTSDHHPYHDLTWCLLDPLDVGVG
jgi:hypothetical protein